MSAGGGVTQDGARSSLVLGYFRSSFQDFGLGKRGLRLGVRLRLRLGGGSDLRLFALPALTSLRQSVERLTKE